MTPEDPPRPYSSSPCYMHEFEDAPAPGAASWEEIRVWRKARRAELIQARTAVAASERRRLSRPIIERLFELLDAKSYPVLGIYWPIQGEIDVRPVARRHIAAGGQAALPVVVTKAAPVQFRAWYPGVPMERGLWNIPVPREPAVLAPNALVVPLVGFDRARFRLGYGGGYYDRTLAAAAPRPYTIGVAFADAELQTIHPQGHDIPMDVILTDRFTLHCVAAAMDGPAGQAADAQRP